VKFNPKRASEAGKKSGATRKAKSVVVEGLANAAARVDLSVEALSAAREAGCSAFKPGNRVNVAELESWLLENGDIVNDGETLNAIRRRNVLAKIQAEKIAHDELAGKFVPAADVAEASRRCSEASAIRVTLRAKGYLRQPDGSYSKNAPWYGAAVWCETTGLESG
jgi:hypothetical protein